MANHDLWGALKPLLQKENITLPESEDFIDKSLTIFKPKMETLLDAIELFRPIDSKFFDIGEDSQEVLQWETTPDVFKVWMQQLIAMRSMFITAEEFTEIQNQVKETVGVKGKHLFMPIRVAIIGKPHGADLKMLVPLIERESLIKRAEKAVAKVSESAL
jgi:nondiscriminating glutamyl-tRNA synthetase